MNSQQDQTFLNQALKLAKKGVGATNPNPMVGAVLVKHGRIIGKGYHKGAGLFHAEIEALKSCKESPKGATLYVNLEPCSHFGRTPPCVDEIIKSKISRVVCSTIDPNPKVYGKGMRTLQKAGILFEVGSLAEQARSLNEAFFTFYEKKRPFIALKFASSIDGKIATKTGGSKWITNENARNFARTLRGQYQAILVGINTVVKDNPHLGFRAKGKKDPLMIILDPKLKIPPESQVLRDNNVLLVTTSRASAKKLKLLKQKKINIVKFPDKQISLKKLLAYLRKKGIISILVEGGGKTLGFFVDEKLFDKIYAFYAPIIIGGEGARSPVGGTGISNLKDAMKLKNVSFEKFNNNLLMIGYRL